MILWWHFLIWCSLLLLTHLMWDICSTYEKCACEKSLRSLLAKLNYRNWWIPRCRTPTFFLFTVTPTFLSGGFLKCYSSSPIYYIGVFSPTILMQNGISFHSVWAFHIYQHGQLLRAYKMDFYNVAFNLISEKRSKSIFKSFKLNWKLYSHSWELIVKGSRFSCILSLEFRWRRVWSNSLILVVF